MPLDWVRMRHLLLLTVALLSACADAAPRVEKRTSANSTPRQAAAVQVQLGQRYMEQGKLDIAMEKLERALAYDPSFPDAHTVIAVLFERINSAKAAEEHYRRAAELAPKSGNAANNYGTFLCKVGKLDLAQKQFDRAIADPFYKTPDVALSNAGTCLMLSGRKDLAEADFRRALEYNPNSTEALYQLAGLLYQKDDFFHARAFIQRFESVGQSNAASLLLAHNIESKLGNSGAAEEYAARLRSQFPDSEQARALDKS